MIFFDYSEPSVLRFFLAKYEPLGVFALFAGDVLLRLNTGSLTIGRFNLGEQLPDAAVFLFLFEKFSLGFFKARDVREAKLMVV